MIASLARMLGRAPRHCRTCGLLKERRSKQFGFTTSGEPVIRSVWACPRQPSTYAFDTYGRRDPTDCHGLAPWACPHERAAYAAGKPGYGACPHRTCPDRQSMDE